ncbi:hypothetical protein L6R53_05715 [Myxococcota bacterium]|nr:hypothetical protein [Myxococcota bacterium]
MAHALDPSPLTGGRLSVLFRAWLCLDDHAPGAWSEGSASAAWDHVVEHALHGATHSHAARCARADLPAPVVVHRHVRGGIAEATAAASQLLGKAADLRVLVAYLGGPGQPTSAAELGAALQPALQGEQRLVLLLGASRSLPGPSLCWERVFTAWELAGPQAPAAPSPLGHPALDGLAPLLRALPTTT